MKLTFEDMSADQFKEISDNADKAHEEFSAKHGDKLTGQQIFNLRVFSIIVATNTFQNKQNEVEYIERNKDRKWYQVPR